MSERSLPAWWGAVSPDSSVDNGRLLQQVRRLHHQQQAGEQGHHPHRGHPQAVQAAAEGQLLQWEGPHQWEWPGRQGGREGQWAGHTHWGHVSQVRVVGR